MLGVPNRTHSPQRVREQNEHVADESKDERNSGLERKQNIEIEMEKILETMISAFGQEDAQDLFLRVQTVPNSFLQDKRPLCRKLAVLVNEDLQVVQQLKDQKKIDEYAKLPLEEIVHKLLKVERKLNTLTCGERKFNSCDVYIFGGEIDGNPVSTSRMYQVESQCWKQLPDLPTARWSPVTAVLDTRIYVLGGFTSENAKSTAFEVFNWSLGAWECLAPIPQPMEGINCSIFHQSLLLWGTENNSLLIFKYDLVQEYWQSLPVPSGTTSHTLICDQTNGRLIKINQSQSGQSDCLVYDLQSTRQAGIWTPGVSVLPFQRAIQVCQIPLSNVKTSREQCVCIFSLPEISLNGGFIQVVGSKPQFYGAAPGWPEYPISQHNVCTGFKLNRRNSVREGEHFTPTTSAKYDIFWKTNHIAVFNIEIGAFTKISLTDDTDDCKVLDFQNGIVLMTDKVGCKLCFLNCQTCLFIPMRNLLGGKQKNFGGSIIQVHDQQSLSATNQDMPM